MSNQTQLQKKIMRRVYIIYTLRTILQPLVIKSLVGLMLVFRLSHYVSFAAVAENMPRSLNKLPVFLSGAIANTEAMTLIIMALMVFVGVWLMRDSRYQRFVHA